jgi:hypothetical protein
MEQNAHTIDQLSPPEPRSAYYPVFAEAYALGPEPPDSKYGEKGGPFHTAQPLCMR